MKLKLEGGGRGGGRGGRRGGDEGGSVCYRCDRWRGGGWNV